MFFCNFVVYAAVGFTGSCISKRFKYGKFHLHIAGGDCIVGHGAGVHQQAPVIGRSLRGDDSFVGLWVGIVHLGHTVVLGRGHADSHGYQLFGISAATAFVAPLHRGRYPYRQCARCACRLHGVAYHRRGYRCRSRFHSLPPHSYRAHKCTRVGDTFHFADIALPAAVTFCISIITLAQLPLFNSL